MNDEYTPKQRKRMTRWLEMSDGGLCDAGHDGISKHTWCSGRDSLKLAEEHPSKRVLRLAAKVADADVRPGLLHLEQRLVNPAAMPSLAAMLAWRI